MTSDETLAGASQQLDELAAPGTDGLLGKAGANARFWLALMIPTAPLLLVYLAGLMGSLTFAYVPIAFAFVGFLYWKRTDHSIRRPSTWVGWLPILLATVSLVLAILLSYAWFSALAFVLVLGSHFNYAGGKIRTSLAALTAPLLCILQPPFQLSGSLLQRFDRLTAWFSSIFLDRFEIPHSLSGSVVQLFEAEVLTSTASAGFLSFYCILFIALALMAIKRVSLWLLPLYAIAAFLTTITINTARVVSHVIAIEVLDADLTIGWYPFAMTAIATVITVGVLYSFHFLISIAFHFIEPNHETDRNPLVSLWNRVSVMDENRAFEEQSQFLRRGDLTQADSEPVPRVLWTGMLGIVAILTALSTVQALRTTTDEEESIAARDILLQTDDSFFDSIESNSVKLENYESGVTPQSNGAGLRNDVWEGSFRNARLQIQITQPLLGWWEPTNGYAQIGWKVLDRDILVGENDDGASQNVTTGEDEDMGPSPFIFVRLRKTQPERLESYLFFSSVSQNGRIEESPTAMQSLGMRLKRRMGLVDQDAVPVAMIQLWVASAEKLSPSDLRELRGVFVKVRESLAETLASEANPQPFPASQPTS
ncbi:Transmembrane exosortase (Exosortase_EpsH) [Rubripirellula lacrimiformis]|uniref:Transmembrane exosortase (Exosortase_EpsH) n=1 Tax=Rubripirellula lacrimiformis TaxID=1930273 RepID=A0A517N8M0_9BACT|nr:exosortase U [Rubripirellula lacrimiformis]QDT03484.1 Transmembrane exosortase (Exosortase_EpsH) [Rubripirellula lacrimiformis]